MIIDMSQAAVNRTAMYHISHHVYELLEPTRTGCQVFGRTFKNMPAPSQLHRIQQEALGALLADPDAYMRANARRSRQSTKSPIVYLDPLYILFGDLKSADTVFVLDLSPVTTPAWHGGSVGRAYAIAFDLICSRRPNVIAISQNTADTLYANYGFPRERIHVIPLYVPHHFSGEAEIGPFHSPQPYVLFVGSLEARKNLLGALASFRLSGLADQGYRCIIAGGNGHGSEEITRAVRETRNVFITGYVSNEELAALYLGASAFLYPSYLEGFGVPLLEAMDFGVPAVASTTGACPAVGGELMRYFDPDDHVGFAEELVRLMGLSAQERQLYATKAKRWVQEQFSVSRFDMALQTALGPAN